MRVQWPAPKTRGGNDTRHHTQNTFAGGLVHSWPHRASRHDQKHVDFQLPLFKLQPTFCIILRLPPPTTRPLAHTQPCARHGALCLSAFSFLSSMFPLSTRRVRQRQSKASLSRGSTQQASKQRSAARHVVGYPACRVCLPSDTQPRTQRHPLPPFFPSLGQRRVMPRPRPELCPCLYLFTQGTHPPACLRAFR